MTNVDRTAPVDAFAPTMMDEVDWRHPSFSMDDDFGKLLHESLVGMPQNMPQNSSSTTTTNPPAAATATNQGSGGLPMTPETLPIVIEKIEHYITRLQAMKAELELIVSQSKNKSLQQSPRKVIPSAVVTPPSSVSNDTSDNYSIQSFEENSTVSDKDKEVTSVISPSEKATSVTVDTTPPTYPFVQPTATKKRRRSIDVATKDGCNSETEEGADPYVLNRR